MTRDRLQPFTQLTGRPPASAIQVQVPTLRLSWWAARAGRNRLFVAGVAIIGTLVIIALAGPFLTPYQPNAVDPPNKYKSPSRAHWFGTDEVGRDVFSRVVHGSRVSLIVALTVQGLALIVGGLVGGVAGYSARWTNELLMRLTDMFLAFPALVLAMAISAAMGASIPTAIVALALVWWPGNARLMWGQVQKVKAEAYVEAARAIGAPEPYILYRHIVPNLVGVMMVKFTLDLGFTILAMASLSFIGLGAQPPTPEWGAMVREGYTSILDAWWVSTFSGLAIMIAVIGFNLLGDGLTESLDPIFRY